jgi:hypothetical protein
LVLAGCGGRSTTRAELGEPRDEPLACDGALRATPRVLATNLDGGRIFVDESTLYVVTPTRVLAVDRCSGDGAELAAGMTIASSAMSKDSLWLLTVSINVNLLRLSKAEAELVHVLADPGTRSLFADPGAVYFYAGYEAPTVYGVPDDQPEPFRLASLERLPGIQLELLGVSRAGLYFSERCDCAPALLLLPFGAATTERLAGSGSPGVRGSHSIHVGAESLYIALNGDGEILSLPLGGGDAQIIVAASDARRRALTSNDRLLCWVEESSLRCFDRFAGGAPREIDRVEWASSTDPGVEPPQPVSPALAPDALYWLRPRPDASTFDLMARAL